MKRSLLAAAFLATLSTAIPARAGLPVTLWSHRWGDSTYQACQAVATDGTGNVFMTGNFVGTLNFGGSDLVSPTSYDIFLVKFDETGAHQWSKSFGVSGHQYVQSIATDLSGNVYIAGYFEGTVNFGGGDLVSAGGTDIFIARFSPGGGHWWSKRFGDAENQYCYSVTVDGSGIAYLACSFMGDLDFGSGVLTSAGSMDIALATFSTTGTNYRSEGYGDANTQYAFAVATDQARNIYLGGYFAGTVDFGGGVLTSSGGYDVYLAKLNSSWNHQWSKRFGSPDSQYLQSIAVDLYSNVYVTGHYYGGIDFGLGRMASAGGDDIFLAKFNTAGGPRWSRRFGDASSNQFGYALATDPSGAVYLAGFTQGTVNFGGGDLVGADDYDGYVAKFDAAGKHLWSERFGDTEDQRAFAVVTENGDDLYLGGYFIGDVDFGAGTMTSAGAQDVFLAKFDAFGEGPLVTSISDVGNDQGRLVHITFARSYYDDVAAAEPVTSYAVFRRDDAPPAASAASLPAYQRLDAGWTEVGSVRAFTTSGYGIDVPTIGDSTVVNGQYYSVFFVRAATASPETFFDSVPDSGYSLDNIAPDVPEGLVCNAGTLSWDESPDEDFDYFSIYGGDGDSFETASLVDHCVAPSFPVGGLPHAYYFVTATDFSGNEGGPAVVNTLSGSGGTPPGYSLSISAYPNPFNPTTTIRYTVPSKGRVVLDVCDVRGSHVATLVNEDKEAGSFTQAWDGKDDHGRSVSSGVYFAWVSHATKTKSYKMLLLK